jgi:hypothetical protein
VTSLSDRNAYEVFAEIRARLDRLEVVVALLIRTLPPASVAPQVHQGLMEFAEAIDTGRRRDT